MWNPPIVKTIATESKGIEDLSAAITSYLDYRSSSEHAFDRRRAIARWRLTELLQERLLTDLLSRNGTGIRVDELALAIAEKKIDPYSAVEQLVNP
jgi:LAO/AO transport system kinase